MTTFTRWGSGVLVASAVVAAVVLVRSQTPVDVLVATPGSPAEMGLESVRTAALRSPSALVLRLTAYQPPRVGTVAVVARLKNPRTGQTREIGRFGIFPDAPFTATTANDAQRFGLTLGAVDLEWLGRADTRVTVSIEPSGGTGAGARLVVGGLEFKEPR